MLCDGLQLIIPITYMCYIFVQVLPKFKNIKKKKAETKEITDPSLALCSTKKAKATKQTDKKGSTTESRNEKDSKMKSAQNEKDSSTKNHNEMETGTKSENGSDSITESKQDEKISATGITGSTQKETNEKLNMRGENARGKEITGVKREKVWKTTQRSY